MKYNFLILKFIIKTFIEKYPLFSTLIINNIASYISNFTPHDNEFVGLKYLFKKKKINIVDVGANIGLATLTMHYLGFKESNYFLFEPNPSLLNTLKKNTKKIKKISYYPFALSDKNKFFSFYIPFYKKSSMHFNGTFNIKILKNYLKKKYKKKILEKINIKKFIFKTCIFDKLNIKKKINLVKIDVEGHEIEVIKSMKNTIGRFYPVIIIEYNYYLIQKINKILNNYEFKFFDYEKNKFLICNFKKKYNYRNIYAVPKNNYLDC